MTGSSPQQQDDPKSSGWDKLIGIGGVVAGITSDPRAKENIKAVGRDAATGLRLYQFNYLNDDRRFEGVMADEVEAVRPDAVVVGADGFQRVLYDRLGITMREIA